MPQNNRPAFLLYKSFYSPVKHLKDDELGLLFRALFDYQNGLEIKDLPPQIGMAFAFFKNQFDLDEQKYQVVLERNKSNGSKGGRPKKEETQANPENPVGFYEPRKGDKEKEKEKEKETEKELKSKTSNPLTEDFEKFWEDYTPVKVSDGKVVPKGSRKTALIAYERARKKHGAEKIYEGAAKYLVNCYQNNRLSCQAAVFLNQERFLDDYQQTNLEVKKHD